MNCDRRKCSPPSGLSRFGDEPASPFIRARVVHLALLSLPFQSFTPTSSSRVNTPSAWCRVAWERTRRCISSWERPWCTQRRLSPSRAASSFSTTLTVCGLFPPPPNTTLSLLGTKYTFPVSFFTPILGRLAGHSLPPLFFSLASFPSLPVLSLLSHHAPVSPRHPATLSSLFIRLCTLATFCTFTLIFIHAHPRRPSQGALHAF